MTMKWYNPQKDPFKIYGFPFYEEDGVYRRMPLSPKAELPEAVYNLSNETAGGQIRFHAKLKTLKLQITLGGKPLFFSHVKAPHLPLTAKQSFDLYMSKDGGDYVFYSITMGHSEETKYYESTLLEKEKSIEVDILLNFPLYNSVDKVLIGVDDDAEISSPQKKFVDDKRLVIYGGSIQQGGCASRPGMVDSNILSRWLNREVINLGFNSSGKAEPELAHIIGSIERTSALIISTEGNCPDTTWLDEKLREFIKIYRTYQPKTPIILMPFNLCGDSEFFEDRKKDRLDRRKVQQDIVKDFNSMGDENIHFLLRFDNYQKEFEGNSIWHEICVDGLHSTDVAYLWSAQEIYKFLKEKNIF